MGAERLGSTELDELNKNTWIADSGASCHMTNDVSNMYNIQEINDSVTIGSGKPLQVTKMGSIDAIVHQRDGTTKEIVLKEVKVVPTLVTARH